MTDFEKYVIARWCYSIGQPIMEDFEYNQLHRTMLMIDPSNEYVTRSWSSDPCPVKLLEKHGLQKYIYSVVLTDKTESIPSLNSFYLLRQELGKFTGRATISYKHDGWNVQASYYDGRLILFKTRGRSNDAIQVDILSERIPQTIPKAGKVTVVMEATVSDTAFEFCKNKFGNKSQRGSVSTLLANKEYSHLISLHAFNIISDEKFNVFETLQEWGFKTPMWKYVYSYEDILLELNEFSNFRQQYGIPTDGLVFSGELTRAIRLLAWEEPVYKSFVLTEELAKQLYGITATPYEEDYGTHRTSIACRIYPITLENSTQRRVPLTNLQRIIDNNLQPGAPLAFRVASSAIADFDEESTRLLQKEFLYREEEYIKLVMEEESLKKCMKNSS